MEADVTRFRDHRGPATWQGKCRWIKREMVKNTFNDKYKEMIIKNFLEFSKSFRFFYYFFYYSFLTFYFLCSTDYYQYYQNVTNDDIIKLNEKFHTDFLLFGYTVHGFIHKDYF